MRFDVNDTVKIGKGFITTGKIGTVVAANFPNKGLDKYEVDFGNGFVGWYKTEDLELVLNRKGPKVFEPTCGKLL